MKRSIWSVVVVVAVAMPLGVSRAADSDRQAMTTAAPKSPAKSISCRSCLAPIPSS